MKPFARFVGRETVAPVRFTAPVSVGDGSVLFDRDCVPCSVTNGSAAPTRRLDSNFPVASLKISCTSLMGFSVRERGRSPYPMLVAAGAGAERTRHDHPQTVR